MKTFLLALLAFTLAAFTSYAQTDSVDTTTVSSLKPQKKQVATELNVNPLNGTISLNNSINQLKFRYFMAPNLALRLGLSGSRVSNTTEDKNPYGANAYNYENQRSSTTIGLNIGVEKHFTGTRRLSPYLGADITVENKQTSQEITQGQSVTTITGAWRDYLGNNFGYSYVERGYFRYGLNLVSGFDFYMAKNFFFGYEVNFGFTQTSFQELDVKEPNSGGSPSDNSETKNSTFSFGPSLMNGIRIGYAF